MLSHALHTNSDQGALGGRAARVSGGGFRLDPDQLARHIERFEQIADRIDDQQRRWERALFAVQPPSPDEPAMRQAKRARESLQLGLEANEAKLKRMREFVNSMKRAHGGYAVQEDETKAAVRDTGSLFDKEGGK